MTEAAGLAELDTWQLVTLAGALGWASGVRLYVVLLVVGGIGRLGWVELPAGLAVLAHPWVLGAAAFMAAIEFFADKIPGVDSLWDLAHTFVRIPAGAALAAGVFSDAPGAAMLFAAILGGGLSAGAHLAKTGGRAFINTSPEPFSNWAASFGEELVVGMLLWLAFVHPAAALVILLALVALVLWLLPRLWRFIAGLMRRLSGRTGPQTFPPSPGSSGTPDRNHRV